MVSILPSLTHFDVIMRMIFFNKGCTLKCLKLKSCVINKGITNTHGSDLRCFQADPVTFLKCLYYEIQWVLLQEQKLLGGTYRVRVSFNASSWQLILWKGFSTILSGNYRTGITDSLLNSLPLLPTNFIFSRITIINNPNHSVCIHDNITNQINVLSNLSTALSFLS